MGDRHVLICWVNGTDAEGISYIQTVQLLGGPGNYNFFTPSVVRQQDAPSETFALGDFTRAERDKLIELARVVKYVRTSRVNSCRTWTRDLLTAMVEEGLLVRRRFEEIDQAVPLKRRLPENDCL
ncbi:hypothetical protein B0H10DRAFT_482449 [Mycena sp. CBHHK59/15]|nr:hypothetical protein B0H10DRAFT_482449 [Mycena sp. CBHHK59/15]